MASRSFQTIFLTLSLLISIVSIAVHLRIIVFLTIISRFLVLQSDLLL